MPLICCRLMWIMTRQAVVIGHFFTVALVALKTAEELPLVGAVLAVAFTTILFSMKARNGGHGRINISMATHTAIFDNTDGGEVADNRGVGLVASTTVF